MSAPPSLVWHYRTKGVEVPKESRSAAEILNANSIAAENGCWEWTLALDKDGYGIAWHLGRKTTAHRVAFFAKEGRYPTYPNIVLHTCDNAKCCNPEHLYEGTQKDNMRDRLARGRWRGGRPVQSKCNRGHVYGQESFNSRGHHICHICKSERKRVKNAQ